MWKCNKLREFRWLNCFGLYRGIGLLDDGARNNASWTFNKLGKILGATTQGFSLAQNTTEKLIAVTKTATSLKPLKTLPSILKTRSSIPIPEGITVIASHAERLEIEGIEMHSRLFMLFSVVLLIYYIH